MKKIFAIALALVMVLSMASAFASPCTSGFSWVKDAAAIKCGKATVEVVPYVTTNSACNEVSYVESDCAAAVNGENVYYALRLTVPADIDMEWWDNATLHLTVKGMVAANNYDIDLGKPALTGDESEDGWVFYHKLGNAGWDEATEDDDFDVADVMNKAVVDEYAKAKVCLTLKSEVKDFDEGVIGDYYVKVLYTPVTGGEDDNDGLLLIVDADDKDKVAPFTLKEGDKDAKGLLAYAASMLPVDNAVGYAFANGEVAVVGKINDKCSTAFYNKVTSFFGIELGTKMDKELIDDNFGWKDKVESCYAWKTQNAMAVVDTECVVAIPKTGDKSVLAWLF